jgi:hypothetical protein
VFDVFPAVPPFDVFPAAPPFELPPDDVPESLPPVPALPVTDSLSPHAIANENANAGTDTSRWSMSMWSSDEAQRLARS